MLKMQTDDWYYTNEGQKYGPVTLVDLQAYARAGRLHPRHDMVWRQGMAGWQTAGEVEGLFARRATAPIEPVVPPSPPATKSQKLEDPVEEVMAAETDWPGCGRRAFIIAMLIFPSLWSVMFESCRGLLINQFGNEITAVLCAVAAFVPMVVGIGYGLSRLANLGMSRWWFCGHFVPGLNVWLGFRCFACPAGYAFYHKLDRAGWVLSIIYGLIVVVAMLAMTTLVTVLLGLVGDPEIRHYFQDALRTAIQSYQKS